MAPVHPTPPTPPGTSLWDDFKWLICQIYEIYGGDCANLVWPDEGVSAVATVRAEFDTNGLPTFAVPQDEQDFRSLLDSLEQNIGNTVTPPSATAKADAQSMIDAMRAAFPA